MMKAQEVSNCLHALSKLRDIGSELLSRLREPMKRRTSRRVPLDSFVVADSGWLARPRNHALDV